MKRRGELDGLPELVQFGQALEDASLETLKDGVMTKDLLGLVEPGFQARGVDSEEFWTRSPSGWPINWRKRGLLKADAVQRPGFFCSFAKSSAVRPFQN